jgi:hypothetical protein
MPVSGCCDHDASISSIICLMVATRPTGRKASIAILCVSGEKAAQPSSRTIVSMSRTWASRTVEATPPFVTIPQARTRVMPSLRFRV